MPTINLRFNEDELGLLYSALADHIHTLEKAPPKSSDSLQKYYDDLLHNYKNLHFRINQSLNEIEMLNNAQ